MPNEPTTEASIIAEAREVAMAVAVQSTIGNMQKHIVAFGIACYTKGQDDANALTAKDEVEKDREVNQMAAQVQSLRYWLASGYCDCEDKDVKSSIPDSLGENWHDEVCEYRQRIEIMNGWNEPAPAKDGE